MKIQRREDGSVAIFSAKSPWKVHENACWRAVSAPVVPQECAVSAKVQKKRAWVVGKVREKKAICGSDSKECFFLWVSTEKRERSPLTPNFWAICCIYWHWGSWIVSWAECEGAKSSRVTVPASDWLFFSCAWELERLQWSFAWVAPWIWAWVSTPSAPRVFEVICPEGDGVGQDDGIQIGGCGSWWRW